MVVRSSLVHGKRQSIAKFVSLSKSHLPSLVDMAAAYLVLIFSV